MSCSNVNERKGVLYMRTKKMLSLDIGASNGRGILGEYDGEKLQLTEISRFPNGPRQIGKRYCWDFPGLLENIYGAVFTAGHDVASVGVDTWGVDFGFLDRDGNLLNNPRAYRDPAFNV